MTVAKPKSRLTHNDVIREATLLDISAEEYHSDPCDTPSLNATVATALVLETPAHAKIKHPRLAGPGVTFQFHTDAMDEGTALHQMLLGDDRVDIMEYPDWRTAEARTARSDSRNRGRVPMLRHKWDYISELGDSLKQQVRAFPIDPPLFVDGMAEQTIVYTDERATYRARLDWLRKDLSCIDDLKKSRTAEPRRFQKQLYALGYDIKAAFYIRAVEAAFGTRPVFRWVAIEPEPPYALSVHVMSPDALQVAERRLDQAIDDWQACLADNNWPAYPLRPNVVEPPPWLRDDVWDDTALLEVPF